jgi:NAD(P)-dependent dehydrogenase (short-subunit alcohol dehydrogenase family)
MKFDLAGRTALVTGGASGIGQAIAASLAMAGAHVVIGDVSPERGESAVGAITERGGRVRYVRHDVTSGADWDRVLGEIAAKGSLDILVNNAGVQWARSIEDAKPDDLRNHLRVNLGGLYTGTMRAIRMMADRSEGDGVIVNVISTYGLVGEEFNAAYCTSKGAARAVTERAATLCRERKLPVRIHAVHPGCCVTPLVEREHRETLPYTSTQDGAALWEEWRLEHPIGRLGRADDIADAVLFLVSDRARFLGTIDLPVDGGYTAQ